MTEQEIIKCIDDGANFCLDFFGDAEHMKSTDNGVCREICPKNDEHGYNPVNRDLIQRRKHGGYVEYRNEDWAKPSAKQEIAAAQNPVPRKNHPKSHGIEK